MVFLIFWSCTCSIFPDSLTFNRCIIILTLSKIRFQTLRFRHDITFKEVSGESEKVTKEMTSSCEETNFPAILARYQLKDIFNANQFGLFCKALPSKSFHFRGKRCLSGKRSKVWITGMATANDLGEKIPMFVIRKSAKPRCFKHVSNLSCCCQAQKKMWLYGAFFVEWLR